MDFESLVNTLNNEWINDLKDGQLSTIEIIHYIVDMDNIQKEYLSN